MHALHAVRADVILNGPDQISRILILIFFGFPEILVKLQGVVIKPPHGWVGHKHQSAHQVLGHDAGEVQELHSPAVRASGTATLQLDLELGHGGQVLQHMSEK